MTRLIGILLCALVLPALANPVKAPHIEAQLIAEKTSLRPGEPATLALRLKMQKHWHTYWRNPGDSGLPTRITWTLPAGFAAGPIQWPVPRRIQVGPLVNFGFEGEIFLLTDIQVPDTIPSGTKIPVTARADWLVCEEICIPGDATLKLELPVDSGIAAADARWSRQFERTRQGLPRELQGWAPRAFLRGGDLVIRLEESGQSRVIPALTFFPDTDGWIENAAPQTLFRSATAYELRVAAAPNAAKKSGPLHGLLVADSGLDDITGAATVSMPFSAIAPTDDSAPVAPAPSVQTASIGWLAALAAAFLGGILLNLMPCVFPVVSIKVLGFVGQSRGNPGSLRAHGLAFTAGVLVSFWIIAGILLMLRAQGEALGWGYPLQSPPLVAMLAVLFFVLALNLSGVFEFGTRLPSWFGHLKFRNAYADSALTGLLATLVATPCTAPFMGAALGYAFVQPAAEAMTVFTALALGMAAPYLLLSFSPRLIARLPRPGAWMLTLKQVLAFPLYLTVAWLAWVLGRQLGVDAMARLAGGLIFVAAAAWLIGSGGEKTVLRKVSAALAIALAAAGIVFAWPASAPAGTGVAIESEQAWQPWSEAAVARARAAGKAVFVDFTAAWCITCQVNKRLVLESEKVDARLRRNDVALFRADWTHRDANITAALSALGRNGVPVYAVYAAAVDRAPVLLSELLTQDRVLSAIEAAVVAPVK
ncbi:MAG: protein-disulfide reductase DsbD family protein [Burkholderiales bacterium]